jgi:hypothetical protein
MHFHVMDLDWQRMVMEAETTDAIATTTSVNKNTLLEASVDRLGVKICLCFSAL